jgi:hypothetical protein
MGKTLLITAAIISALLATSALAADPDHEGARGAPWYLMSHQDRWRGQDVPSRSLVSRNVAEIFAGADTDILSAPTNCHRDSYEGSSQAESRRARAPCVGINSEASRRDSRVSRRFAQLAEVWRSVH